MSISNSYCDIYLIRHGETDWNIQGRLQGHTDIPLNEKGEEQALGLKEKFTDLHFSAVYSSDLSRAKKTASIILDQKKIEIVETAALRERYMGLWEGKLKSELTTWFNENNLSTVDYSKEKYLAFKWQNDIESYADVYKRLSEFIQSHKILGSTLLLSSHGGVLRSVLHTIDFRSDSQWEVSNCAYLKLRVNDAGEISLIEQQGTKLIHELN